MTVHDDMILIKRFKKLNRKLEGNADAISEHGVTKPHSCLIEVNQVEKMTAFEDCSFKVVHLTAIP